MTALDIRGPAWLADAICSQTDPAIFMPEKGGSNKPAKKICASCPAMVACLAWAVAHEIPDGIWGGVTARERQIARNAA